jgi:hypothetical protein
LVLILVIVLADESDVVPPVIVPPLVLNEVPLIHRCSLLPDRFAGVHSAMLYLAAPRMSGPAICAIPMSMPAGSATP